MAARMVNATPTANANQLVVLAMFYIIRPDHLSIGDNPMTRVEYDPLRLANEIEAALAKYGSGSDHRMCKAIHFFEGELRLIAECLRCADPQNPDADRRVIDWSACRRLPRAPASR
jgi:hypothetical protein